MNDKKLDCVELQRKIREEIFEEAEGNIDKINHILDEDTKNNELLKILLEKSKMIQQLEVA